MMDFFTMKLLNNDVVESYPLDTNIIRTGVPLDGNVFHSIFYAYRYYRKLSVEDKAIFVNETREKLVESITMETWIDLQESSMALTQIVDMARVVLEEDTDNDETLQILCALVDREVAEEEIFPRLTKECSYANKEQCEDMRQTIFTNRLKDTWYRLYYEAIHKQIDALEKNISPPSDIMPPVERMKAVYKLAAKSYSLLDTVRDRAFEKFKKDVRYENMDIFTFASIAGLMDLQCSILVIDADTGFFSPVMRDIFEDKPCVVLLYHPCENRFESIGRIIEVDGVKNVSRLFTEDDELLARARRFLSE
jgi:hypothetical protein